MASMRDRRQIRAGHPSREIHVGHQERQRAAHAIEHQLGGLGALALNDVVLALLEEQHQHLPLHGIVFDNKRGRAKGF